MRNRWKTMTAMLLILIMCIGTALSDTLYVKTEIESPLSLRDENTNEVLCTIPAGAALEPDGSKSTDLFAYVTYDGYSGYVLWNYLTRNAQGSKSQTSLPTQANTVEIKIPELEDGYYLLNTVGAVIQQAEGNNKAKGAERTEMKVTAEDNVIVTAKIPKGSSLDYWVINGVRYDFLRTVKWMRITAFDRSWTIEAVYKKTRAETLHSPEEIQAARNGSILLAQVKNGEMCHIKDGTKGGGGWITSFDFTEDYENRATGASEKGGQLTAKIRASIPRGRHVAGWKLDETKFYQPAQVNDFIVRMLDTSLIYEPIFSIDSEKPKAPSNEQNQQTEETPPRDPTHRQTPWGQGVTYLSPDGT